MVERVVVRDSPTIPSANFSLPEDGWATKVRQDALLPSSGVPEFAFSIHRHIASRWSYVASALPVVLVADPHRPVIERSGAHWREPGLVVLQLPHYSLIEE